MSNVRPFEMDATQVNYFKQRYASMSDEELALLVATRRDALSEEANEALAEVLNTKSLPQFVQEVNATVADLNSQAHAANELVRKQREHNRRAKVPLAFFFVFVALVAASMAVFYSG